MALGILAYRRIFLTESLHHNDTRIPRSYHVRIARKELRISFQEAFMDALKSRFVETVGDREFGGTRSKAQAPYYLMRLEDNLVMPMSEQHIAEYGRGSGGELDGKMKALRSSSAMTFNLLGNGPVHANGQNGLPAGTYAVEFEHQLPTLARNPRPANLDAKLESADGEVAIYCEMKLAEWILNKASGLRPQYLEIEGYMIPAEPACAFRDAFASLCAGGEDASGRLAPKLARYDAFQMLKHLLAIYTEAVRKARTSEPLPKRIILLNCVWEIVHPEALGRYEAKYRELEAEEHAQYREFAEVAHPLSALFAEIGIDFSIRYLSFAEMRNSLDLEPSHQRALDRYII